MTNIKLLIEQLNSADPATKSAAVIMCKQLSISDRKDLITNLDGGLAELHKLLTGIEKPIINTENIKLPDMFKVKNKKAIPEREMKKLETERYGIYTVTDANFFPGVVAAINSLRDNCCNAPVAVIDIGLDQWMINYLKQYDNVQVLDMTTLRETIRFTDVNTDESPIMKGWAYKAFGIIHYNLFDAWTFIDADFLPLCNLETHMLPLIKQGKFISTEDGTNTWDKRHEDATGVKPGQYTNINAGFISVNMRKHDWVIYEWRNLMTRYKPYDLWYGDQGALNVILDKYDIEKTMVDKRLWNQTWLNERMTNQGEVDRQDNTIIHKTLGKQIMAWHGVLWYKLWHQIGIDHFRKNATERAKFRKEAEGKSPKAIVDEFKRLLFLDKYNRPLRQIGHILRV